MHSPIVGHGSDATSMPMPMPMTLVLLFAAACGLAVANVYYAQPLLDTMAAEFGFSAARLGLVITLTQVGYGLGLILLVPLGDLLNRRRLIVGHLLLSAAALIAVATATSGLVLLLSMTAVGLLAVVTQTLVAYAGSLAAAESRGKVVGVVTSGVVLGILSARTVAGLLADIGGWRLVYVSAAGLTLLTALALLRHLPNDERQISRTSYRRLIGSVFSLLIEERILRVRAGIALLLFMAFNILWTPLVLPLSAPPLSLSHSAVGAFGLIGIVGALAAARAGQLADRGRSEWTTGVSLGLLVLSWLPIAFVPQSLWLLVLGIVLLDLAVQAVHVTNQSLIYKLRPEARSRMTAAYMLFYALGSGVGSLAATAAYAAGGWTAVCTLGALVSALALMFWAMSLKPTSIGLTTPSTQ